MQNKNIKYTEEIFNQLSKGEFVSANSISSIKKRYYDALEESFDEYYDYYSGIGFYLEAGNGYYYFTRNDAKVELERKLETIYKWIDYLSFLKTFNSIFGVGFTFRQVDIETQIGCDVDLKDKALKLYSDKKKYADIVERLIKELKDMGFIEEVNEMDGTWKVLSSFNYIEELIDSITITEEVDNEKSE